MKYKIYMLKMVKPKKIFDLLYTIKICSNRNVVSLQNYNQHQFSFSLYVKFFSLTLNLDSYFYLFSSA